MFLSNTWLLVHNDERRNQTDHQRSTQPERGQQKTGNKAHLTGPREPDLGCVLYVWPLPDRART